MTQTSSKAVSLIIPNYNGSALLQQNLPSVQRACQAHGEVEIVVVDDGSSDDSRELLERAFAGVRLLALPEHRGFIAAVNHGVREARGEVVVLLNSDVEVEPDFLAPLLETLDQRTFAVSACSLTEEGLNEALSLATFEQGELHVLQPGIEAPDPRHGRPCTNFHASGGFSAFARDKFLALGGLDPLYHPFYWEDVDICFRAWKRGWRVVYEPRSRVHHRAHGTISCYFGEQEVRQIYQQNKHAFVLKNITDAAMLGDYFARLAEDLFRAPLTEEEVHRARGALQMVRRMRRILDRRGRGGPEQVVSDAEVLRRSANVPC